MKAKIGNLKKKFGSVGSNLMRLSSKWTLRSPRDPRSRQDFYPQDLTTTFESIAPFLPSPMDVVKRMLQLAELHPGEVLYDLGCGDGRIVLTAAKDFRARAVGVDLNATLIDEARKKADKLSLSDAAQFIDGNMFDVDLRPADVVTIYLLTSANEKLRPKLESELRPGTRVVTHDFPIINWQRQSRIDFEGESGKHTLFLYIWRGDEIH